MVKRRSPDSLLTRLENMEIGDEIWTTKSNGYVADNIATVKSRYEGRKYKQLTVFTHVKPLDDQLKLCDFQKVIFITRIA